MIFVTDTTGVVCVKNPGVKLSCLNAKVGVKFFRPQNDKYVGNIYRLHSLIFMTQQ